MNSEELAIWLEQHLPRLLRTHLTTQHTKVSHVLNWGGFVNHSFCVTDGSTRFHLKLTNNPEHWERFQTWRDLHDVLEQRYRTPKLLEWIEATEVGFAGFLFEYVDGHPADFCENPELVKQITELVDCLHNDSDIRSYLHKSASVKTYFDFFVETYIRRFTSDLKIIGADRPPFISTSLFTFMREQMDELREAASRMETFHNPAVEPVHCDLNEGNVLVTSTGWFILDWDDLSVGDPAVEFAVLLWPIVYAGKPLPDFAMSCRDDGFMKRFEICLRAQLLDEVIDNVADYVDAHTVPSRQTEVQLVKKKRHEDALKRYIAIWPR
jgi:thiamine kinase-like enzyme